MGAQGKNTKRGERIMRGRAKQIPCRHVASTLGLFFLVIIASLVAVSLPVDLLAQPESKPGTAAQIPYHMMTYKVNEVQAEIAINGVPVLYGEYKGPMSYSGLINMWVKPGKNVVTVRVMPLLGPQKKGQFFELTVSVGRSAQAAINGPKLAQFRWRSEESREKLPLEKIFKFTPLEPPPSELWTKAEVLKLDEETRKGAEECIQRLSKALVQRNIEDLTKLLEFRSRERDRWLRGESEKLSDVRKDVEELLNDAEFQPVDMGSLQMHLIADGQLVWVTGKGFSRFLKGKGGESETEADVYLARIGGNWTLAR